MQTSNKPAEPAFTSLPTPLKFQGNNFARAILRLFGWRVMFNGLPGPKGVMIAYPHTSNWDFVVSILTKWSMGYPLRYLAKESLFTGISGYTVGPLVRYWGGVRVERAKASGMIADTVRQLNESDFFWLALSPEGTRGYRDHWKSGFYQMALQAKVPLGFAFFDYAKKEVGMTDFMMLTGDEAADMAVIAAYYAKRGSGKCPELAAPIVLQNQGK
jgi:1-acyl-sn-glycerol-3-phosphate acyltransferase